MNIHTLDLEEAIQTHSTRFHSIDDLQPLIKQASRAKYVLLGEATHGTSEFYTIRAELTKQLIAKHGFSFVAVEGDWPSCYEVNRYCKELTSCYQNAFEALEAFQRWPQWMWANKEMILLLEWLKQYNHHKPSSNKVGFHGIDVYSLWESMEEIVKYLKSIDSPDISKAKTAFSCFEPYHKEMQLYGVASAFYGQDCLEEMIELLQSLHNKRHLNEEDDEAMLHLRMNALAVENAERYYHTMITNDSESWNIRDRHMAEAINEITNHYGPDTKGIIWEHNTHIGDARATDMQEEGMVNVGQLTREKFGAENIYAVGFGTYEGTVIAADKWGEPAKKMIVPKASPGSWEHALHQSGSYNKFITFDDNNRKFFSKRIGHRAIGVVYHSNFEHLGNYVPSNISERYDAFVHVEQTNALTPLS